MWSHFPANNLTLSTEIGFQATGRQFIIGPVLYTMAAHVVPLNSQSTAVWITLANFITVWITLAGLLMAWITLAGLLSVDYISRFYHSMEYISRISHNVEYISRPSHSVDYISRLYHTMKYISRPSHNVEYISRPSHSVDYISRLYHNVEYFSRPSKSRFKSDCHWVPVSIVYDICIFIWRASYKNWAIITLSISTTNQTGPYLSVLVKVGEFFIMIWSPTELTFKRWAASS